MCLVKGEYNYTSDKFNLFHHFFLSVLSLQRTHLSLRNIFDSLY